MKGFLIWLVLFICSAEVFSQTETKTLSAEKIIQLLPQKINGFRLNDSPKSKLIKLGTLQYCMAEKEFAASGKRSIKILLFDYKEAPIMYTQATRRWLTFKPIETDSLIYRPSILPATFQDCKGWESYDARRKNSQILVGIANRLYLSIEGTNVDLEFLRSVLNELKIETFPK